MTKMKRFTVRRSTWVRGGEGGDAQLLNGQGNMCCLGFAICQISKCIPIKQLKGAGYPDEVFKRESFLTVMDDGDVADNALTTKAASINDDTSISDTVRERRLTKLFRQHNIIVKFVD